MFKMDVLDIEEMHILRHATFQFLMVRRVSGHAICPCFPKRLKDRESTPLDLKIQCAPRSKHIQTRI
jgi:hypothetical protein